MKNDYYNGKIVLAFLLNVRSALNSATQPAEAIADFVLAQRTRRRVLTLCQALMDSPRTPKGADQYWIKATMAEAYAGLGEDAKAKQLLDDAKTQSGVAGWMIQTTDEQLAKLKTLVTKSPLDRIVFREASAAANPRK